jgi:hypothetical protein
MADAVPLTPGAPLPSPARAASFAVTEPEPAGTDPGGSLPIFESVESDYPHTRRRGLPRPSELRADQPTPAGQPNSAGQPAGASASLAPRADGRPAAAAADTPAAGGLTSAGLPQRIPQASLVPGAPADLETRQAAAAESAQTALGRLASFQRGSRRAKAVGGMDRDAKQPARDD